MSVVTRFVSIVFTALLMAVAAGSAFAQEVTMWRSPSCGCCKAWAKHLERAGFSVRVVDERDLMRIKADHKVPTDLASCHTAVVDGYVIEGHVPPREIRRLLAERPKAVGLSVPGMPSSAPGMDGAAEPYDVVLFSADGGTTVYQSYK